MYILQFRYEIVKNLMDLRRDLNQKQQSWNSKLYNFGKLRNHVLVVHLMLLSLNSEATIQEGTLRGTVSNIWHILRREVIKPSAMLGPPTRSSR